MSDSERFGLEPRCAVWLKDGLPLSCSAALINTEVSGKQCRRPRRPLIKAPRRPVNSANDIMTLPWPQGPTGAKGQRGRLCLSYFGFKEENLLKKLLQRHKYVLTQGLHPESQQDNKKVPPEVVVNGSLPHRDYAKH